MIMYELDIPIKVVVLGNFQKLSDRLWTAARRFFPLL